MEAQPSRHSIGWRRSGGDTEAGKSENATLFNFTFWKGHWLKVIEFAMGIMLVVLPLILLHSHNHAAKTNGSIRKAALSASCLAGFVAEVLAAFGALLVANACMGALGAIFRRSRLLWAHLVLLLLLGFLFSGFLLFCLYATGGPSATSAAAADLSSYPSWYRHRVHNAKHWRNVVSCMQRHRVCSESIPAPPVQSPTSPSQSQDFYRSHLSPSQYGCCKPPEPCNYTYVDGTKWIPPADQTNSAMECSTWNNDPSQLCYECDSCKIAVIQETRSEWKKARALLFAVVFVLVALYAFCGCGLFKFDNPQAF
ncbi:hypothetical protein KP509_30G014100 [Ceratopteris richardii]|uniref:Uncharacterized protein n=1 Tax=Ceratopteris richardii TaxID=49495 RepID=A0A8T2QZW9_CERRI|nr:hypothetical protein KP509_30G014100 [Ceratopteris richardii]